jgi:predicted nucleic acid-binding protein
VAGVIVLDASVVIAYLDDRDADHDRAVQLLAREIDDDFAMSVVTVAEVLVGPARAGRAAVVLEALSDLVVSTRPLNAEAAMGVAALRSATGLRMPDCCVLFAAEDAGARVATFDDRLRRATAARGVGIVGV